jgi:preprotein translocase subunit YajC
MLSLSTLLTSTTAAAGNWQTYGSIILIVLMLAAMYFIMIRPQRKQEKEAQDMRNGLQVGDEIVTIGGIVGIIISITDETITIISSRDKTRIQFLKTAVSRVQVPAAEKEEEKKPDKEKDK